MILLDLQMPGMDGIETRRHLKDGFESADVPVVFITGRGDDEQSAVAALEDRPCLPADRVRELKDEATTA